MGSLTSRVRDRARIKAQTIKQEELDRAYRQKVEHLTKFEHEEDRQIHLRLQAYAELAERILVDDEDPDHLDPAGQSQLREHRSWHWQQAKSNDPAPPAVTESYVVGQIRKAAAEDRRNNVLYQLWMETRLKQGPVDLELEEFSEAVAGRALVRLLGLIPNGANLLVTLSDDPDPSWVPDTALVRRFIERGGLAETDSQLFLARLFKEVPKSRRALYRILGAYKLVVRLQGDRDREPVAGMLPGEDYGQELVTWDQLSRLLGVPPTAFERTYHEDASLSRAVSRYLAGDSLEAAAGAGPVSRGALRRRLIELKLLRSRGRPKRSVGKAPASEIHDMERITA